MYLLMRTGVTDPSYKVFWLQGFLATWFSRWQPVGVGVGCWILDAGRWMLGILVCSLQSTVCSLLFLVFSRQSSVVSLRSLPQTPRQTVFALRDVLWQIFNISGKGFCFKGSDFPDLGSLRCLEER